SGLLRPTAGKIELDGRRIDGLPPNRIAALGVARTYQNIRLFGGLSAVDNVVVGEHLHRHAPFWRHLLLLPSARAEERTARTEADAELARVGMRERASTRAFNLSYGEQRRVEIVRDLRVAYGHVEAVRGVSLSVAAGEIVALIGPNGAGKSSTLNAIGGLLRPTGGSVRLEGRELAGVASHAAVAAGIVLVPEGRA